MTASCISGAVALLMSTDDSSIMRDGGRAEPMFEDSMKLKEAQLYANEQ